MARRLVAIVGVALVVACGVPLASARQDPEPPAESAPSKKAPAKSTKAIPGKSDKAKKEKGDDPSEPSEPTSSLVVPPSEPVAVPQSSAPQAPVEPPPPLPESDAPKSSKPNTPTMLATPPPYSSPAETNAPTQPAEDNGLSSSPRAKARRIFNRETEPRVDDVQRTQAPSLSGENLPPARTQPGMTPSSAAPHPQGQPFEHPPDRFPIGSNAIGVTAEIQGPGSVNIRKETTYKILVKNTGTTEAVSVVVRDPLPPALKFVRSKPEPAAAGVPAWHLGALSPGAVKEISVTVLPEQEGSWDHAATVTVMGGSRARLQVRQPKLKIEMSVNKSKVLKGEQVQFDITVTNTGNGPASNVTVLAKLGAGLKHAQGSSLELPLKDLGKKTLNPNDSVPIPLVVNTVGGGEFACDVTATSPDVVTADPNEAHAEKTVTVVEPMLKLTFNGSTNRGANSVASYTLTVSNPGSAPVRGVKLAAWVPAGAKVEDAGGAKYNVQSRLLLWKIPQLDENQSVEHKFFLLLGGPGKYQVDVATEDAGGKMRQDQRITTDVIGKPIVRFNVTERRRVVDRGEEAVFQVRVVNSGLAEATRLQFSAQLSDHFGDIKAEGEDGPGQPDPSKPGLVIFPQIDRLGPKEEVRLTIRAKADKAGLASCQVFLMYDNLQTRIPMQDSAYTEITDPAGDPGN